MAASGVQITQSAPDVPLSGRAYPKARSTARSSARGSPMRSPAKAGRRASPSASPGGGGFVAKGLLNLDNLQIKKAKNAPDWMLDKWSSNEGRDGWVAKPRFPTRSAMKKFHEGQLRPDPTFDVDGDGMVSAEDLRLASHYDTDLSGTLEPDELRRLRIGVVSEALDNIARRQATGQMHAGNPAVIKAVRSFANVAHAVDHPDFSRRLERLRACMNPTFEGRSSVNVREIMKQPRASDSRHPERRRPTPDYLKEARHSAARAMHASRDVETPDGPTPRWLQQRDALSTSMQVEKDDASVCASDLDTVRALEPSSSGWGTKSELVGARKEEIHKLAEHYLDYENFGGDYCFPNSLKEKRKGEKRREAASGRRASGEPSPERVQAYAPRSGPPGKAKRASRITGTGTHVTIFSTPDPDVSPETYVREGAKAGRDGPIYQGGRIPTPLYNDVSVATFSKPLEGQRTPGGRRI